MGFVNEGTEDGGRRTIDYDRGATLRCLERGQPEKPYTFELQYLKSIVQFFAICKLKQTPKNTQEIAWEVIKINLPEGGRGDVSEVVKTIREGLEEYGFTGRRDHIESVTVFFPNIVV
ncbi:MAG TPA: hypothetical protein VGD95_05105 [Micavibrio sp.]